MTARLSALAGALLALVLLTPIVPLAGATEYAFLMTADRVGIDTWQVNIASDRPALTYACTLVRQDTRQPIECSANRPFVIQADPSTSWRFEAIATDEDGNSYSGAMNYAGQPTTPPGGEQPGGGTPPPPTTPGPVNCVWFPTAAECQQPTTPEEPTTPVEPVTPTNPAREGVYGLMRQGFRIGVSKTGRYVLPLECPTRTGAFGEFPSTGCSATFELRDKRTGRRLDRVKDLRAAAGTAMQKRRIPARSLRFLRGRRVVRVVAVITTPQGYAVKTPGYLVLPPIKTRKGGR
jgi:hypothetical protein